MNSDGFVRGWFVGLFPDVIDPIVTPIRYCSHGNRSRTVLRARSSSGLEKVSNLRLDFLVIR